MTLEFRPARPSEFDDVMAFLARQFKTPAEGFTDMTHAFTPRPSVIRQTHLALRDGKLVGVYGIFPRRLRIAEAELSAAGIGGVCARRDLRGQGIMTFMIRTGDEIMRAEGIDVAALGGERFRYRSFGWDGGGRQYRFVLNKRCLTRCRVPKGPARRYDPGRDFAKLRRAHDALACRLVRSSDYFRRVIQRKGREIFVSDRRGKFAYAFCQRPSHLVEVAGHPEGIGAIAWRLLERKDVDEVTLTIGPENGDLSRWLVQTGAESRSHFSASWQIKIVDLAGTLRKLLPEIRRRAPRGLPEGRVTLQMLDSNQSATLRYGRRFAVEPGSGRARLALSDAEMTRLILGPFPLADTFDLPGKLRDLDGMLPIPWHWPMLDRM
jgi:predicted N-acetyltransferase YhbS